MSKSARTMISIAFLYGFVAAAAPVTGAVVAAEQKRHLLAAVQGDSNGRPVNAAVVAAAGHAVKQSGLANPLFSRVSSGAQGKRTRPRIRRP
ncbi:MAG: hypothetical protein AMS14_08250 [Planctomycetes bacterium DG_20]|nr:MAG: hypothetical protein AMS14_08250 [Planctomycetes bacterium DG_20]